MEYRCRVATFIYLFIYLETALYVSCVMKKNCLTFSVRNEYLIMIKMYLTPNNNVFNYIICI